MVPKNYYFLHVSSFNHLMGFTFAFAENPQKHKKKVSAIVTRILALIGLVEVFGLIAKLQNDKFGQGWVIVKVLALLFVSGLGGTEHRQVKSFIQAALVISVGIAVFMVYFRPF
tara:strand:- start:28158 stop:28499 length:342 start_codon:yes stop_codon:yes gene_type:complete